MQLVCLLMEQKGGDCTPFFFQGQTSRRKGGYTPLPDSNGKTGSASGALFCSFFVCVCIENHGGRKSKSAIKEITGSVL